MSNKHSWSLALRDEGDGIIGMDDAEGALDSNAHTTASHSSQALTRLKKYHQKHHLNENIHSEYSARNLQMLGWDGAQKSVEIQHMTVMQAECINERNFARPSIAFNLKQVQTQRGLQIIVE